MNKLQKVSLCFGVAIICIAFLVGARIIDENQDRTIGYVYSAPVLVEYRTAVTPVQDYHTTSQTALRSKPEPVQQSTTETITVTETVMIERSRGDVIQELAQANAVIQANQKHIEELINNE